MRSKKGLILVIILSISLLFSLFYVNYFTNNLYLKDFKETESVEVFSKYSPNKEKACYGSKLHCRNISYKVEGKVDTKILGNYKLTYTIKRRKKKLVKVRIVKVVDTKKPKIIVDGVFINVCKNGKNNYATLKAVDNYDGDITDKIEYTLNGNKIIYKVSDSSGNEVKKEYDVIVNDNEKPTIVLNGAPIIYLSVGTTYKESGVAAIDNCDGDISDKVKIESNVDTKKEGTYEVKYTVTDEFGNTNTIKRTVKIFSKNEYNPGDIGSKVIYLTFDDGPGEHTARLLDILKAYNVKVTFFVTNRGDDDLIKREYDEGHTVALHTASHNYAQIYASQEAYMEDLLSVQNRVKRITGMESKIVRFPGGSSNTISRKYRIGIMSELTAKLEELGYRYFDWTVISGDAGDTRSTDRIIQNVINGVGDGKLNVILQHDIKGYSVDAVESIIQWGLSNGYTFAPLTMESPNCHQKVNN